MSHSNQDNHRSARIVSAVRRVVAASVISVFAIASSWSTAFAADYTMTIAHLYPDDLSNNEVAPAMERFKQVVESATGGVVEVAVFGNGALGSEVETGKQAQKGKTVQSVLISSGATSSFFRNYQIATTPFLFPNYKTAWEFFDSEYFANFMKGALDESGLRYLGTFDDGGGFVAFTNNKRLIRTMADLEGLKIRVEENPAHIATMKALGANATPLPWAEVPTALTTGLAHGQFNAPGVNDIFRLYDTTDYTTWSGHVYNTVTWFVSDAWLKSLPREHQEIVIGASREAVAIGHGIATLTSIVGWVNSCKNFKECYILPDDEKAKMKEVARPAFKEWITTDYGMDVALVDEFWAAVDKTQEEISARNSAFYLD